MQSLVRDYGLFILFLLIAMESAGIPLPGETALVAAGVHASRVLPWSERFFKRHGGKTIFLARFIAVLRVTAAWIAGLSKMKWWLFFVWNAAGGIVWAVAVGLVAYYAGEAAAAAINRYGLIAGAAIVGLLVVGAFVFRVVRRRMLEAESKA